MENTHSEKYGTYILVWLGLVTLATFSTAITGLNIGGLTVFILVTVAVIQSIFIARYFIKVKNNSKLIKFLLTSYALIFFIILLITLII